jgi:YebC/PmpR family DNA-binding regulatory protein
MAGHSKWANIKHRKAAQDAKRGKIWTKVLKEVTVAVKAGGPDLESNPRLRLAIQNAKGVNVPKDTMQRAIDKAAGAGGEDYVEVNFEGYGPEGVAVFVECATDNNMRTVAAVRSYFNKYNGSLGKDGCLQFIFERKGVFLIEESALNGMDFDDFTMEMIDGGAEDVESEEGMITVTTLMEDFGNAQNKLTEINVESQEAGLQRIPTTHKALNEESLKTFWKLIDALEDNDDVQKVYHNLEFTEDMTE